MMHATVGQVRRVIQEALEGKAVTERLQAIAASKKPYLKGQWQEVRGYNPGFLGTCWEAEDPELGKVYLSFSYDTTYKNYRGSRIRDTRGTRKTYRAVLSQRPNITLVSFDDAKVFLKAVTGENRQKEDAMTVAVRKTMLRLFGVDPLVHLGPLHAGRKETP